MSNDLMIVELAEVTSLSERIRKLMPGGKKLTSAGANWHADWRGQVCIFRTVDDVA